MKQRDIFLETEGDRWHERNHAKAYVDQISPLIPAAPTSVVEIGCGSGKTLQAIWEKYGCDVVGVEPSMKAVFANPEIPIYCGTADRLPLDDERADLVIFGFCLYLTDPSDWMTIAKEADRILKPGGHIMIHDFSHVGNPFKVVYHHDPRVSSWHYDWSKLWMGHPAYSLLKQVWVANSEQMVSVLHKAEIASVCANRKAA
jgi:SAM-dependent methyltransferase